MSNFKSFIQIDPSVRGGKPCVAGTRIAVSDVLEYLRGGMSIEDILQDFPQLTREGVLACQAYEYPPLQDDNP